MKVSVGVRQVSVGVKKGLNGFKKLSRRCHTVSGTFHLESRRRHMVSDMCQKCIR